MFISGIGTALPPGRFTQTQCWDALQGWPGLAQLSSRSRALLRKVLLADNGIVTRHLATDGLVDACSMDPDVLHHRFIQHGPALGAEAATRALAQAGRRANEVDALIVSTCTGYLCPGLSSYIAERLGLRADIIALDLVGQGCGAALPNLRNAEALLAGGQAECVLSICVEICSAAFYLDDDPGVLISACLFADGAGAAVLTATPAPAGRRVAWRDSSSLLDPGLRDALRFEQKGGLLRNILTPPVPALAAEKAVSIFRVVAERAEVKHKEIAGWILHAGGRDVLVALQQRLGLQADDLQWSASVLRDIGNVSSPFVYFVLERALRAPARSGWWWLSSFGAGFSCHGALLEVS
jgi:alkylresorcinol/alkylpyrone synthase